MEERASPSGDGNLHNHNHNHNHNPPLPQPPQYTIFRSGSYVVQVPKDQIYRVPPPENALIVERHRNPVEKKRSPLFYICIVLLIIIIILGIAAGVSYIILKPKDPKFYIQKVVVKKQKLIEYDITLKVDNPNGKTGIFYDEDGVASLSFRQKEIAVGKYPDFYQDYSKSAVFDVVLSGSNSTALPREIGNSIKGQDSKVPVSLSLSMNIPVRLKVLVVNTGRKKFDVVCNFMVDSLTKDIRVVSQECRTNKG